MTCPTFSALASPRVCSFGDIMTSPGKAFGAICLIVLIFSAGFTSPARLIQWAKCFLSWFFNGAVVLNHFVSSTGCSKGCVDLLLSQKVTGRISLAGFLFGSDANLIMKFFCLVFKSTFAFLRFIFANKMSIGVLFYIPITALVLRFITPLIFFLSDF